MRGKKSKKRQLADALQLWAIVAVVLGYVWMAAILINR